MNTLTEENFLEDVKDHKMIIIKNDGIYRHLRFKREKSVIMMFDLITWPEHIVFTGDMGTYCFRRLEDMFCFFRSEDVKKGLVINPDYWAEKVLSQSIFGGGIKKFSVELFREQVMESVRTSYDLKPDEEIPEHLRDEVLTLLLCEDEHDCFAEMRNFVFNKNLDFDDFWENSFEKYTYHFLWCCYAIVWAIGKYDKKIEEKR